MTNTNIHVPARHSTVDEAIVSVLTAATIILAGFLAIAQFAAVI